MKEFKNVYIMELPNTQNESALELWKKGDYTIQRIS